MTKEELTEAALQQFGQEWQAKEKQLLEEVGGDIGKLPGAWLIPNSLSVADREEAITMALDDINRARQGQVPREIIIRFVEFGFTYRTAIEALRKRKNRKPITLTDLGLE